MARIIMPPLNEQETTLALAEYHLFCYADAIAQATAVRSVIAKDEKVDNAAPAAAVDAAASWFQNYF